MAVDLLMPKLGLTMEEGTLVRWRVAEGDRVEQGQTVLEVETDKVVVEVEAPASGVMGPLLVAEGETVPLSTLLARIYAPEEEIPQHQPSGPEEPVRTTPLARRIAGEAGVNLARLPSRGQRRIRAEDVRRAAPSGLANASRGRIFSTPRARKRAAELGLDWRTVPGSGPGGRVVEKDVLAAAQAVRGQYAGVEIAWETPSSVQKVTAERMVASFGSAPHFYLSAEAHAAALLDARARLLPLVQARAGVRLTITDILVRVLGVALAEFPRANAFWAGGRIGLARQVNVAIAVATEVGLVAPVLRRVDRKSLSEIARERAGLVERARAGRLSVNEMSGGTFTFTNLGMFRVDVFQAILNPPQAAILALGRIAPRPAVVNGQLAAAPTAMLSLSCDHRLLDGALAAQFLGRVVELVEEPYGLLV